MTDNRMLQMILDTVTGIRADFKRLETKIDGVEQRLTERIDKLGAQLSYLEDDTPTIKEFNRLERRVSKLEKQTTSL